MLILSGTNPGAGVHRRIYGWDRDRLLSARLVIYFKVPEKSRAYYPINTGTLDWDATGPFNGHTHSNAYKYGYSQPTIANGVIILGFGRQLYPDDTNPDTGQPYGFWGSSLFKMIELTIFGCAT